MSEEEGQEVVVVWKPWSSVSGVFNVSVPQTGGGTGGQNIAPLIAQSQAASDRSVSQDADVVGEEVTVTAKKLKDTVYHSMVALTQKLGVQIQLPCAGPFSGRYLYGMIGSFHLRLTNKNYGPNRAGANNADSSTSSIPVEMNMNDFITYGNRPGGMTYVLMHEIAHSLPPMRELNRQYYNNWYQTIGKDLNLGENGLRDAFGMTAEFREIEARANTIARALARELPNLTQIGFEPTNSYSTQC
jgi:hypothetical protein